MIAAKRTRQLGLTLVLLFVAVTAHAGAWGRESFANDDALDWVENELKPGGLRAVERTVARVAASRGYLQAPDGCYAIAACEVLAAVQGRPSADLPEEIAAIAKRLSAKVSDTARKNAREALDRILSKESELRELWEDAKGDFEPWKKSVEELKSRV